MCINLFFEKLEQKGNVLKIFNYNHILDRKRFISTYTWVNLYSKCFISYNTKEMPRFNYTLPYERM